MTLTFSPQTHLYDTSLIKTLALFRVYVWISEVPIYFYAYLATYTASSGEGSSMDDVNENSRTDNHSITDQSSTANIQLAVGIPVATVGVVTIVIVVFVAIIVVIKKRKVQKEVVTKDIALPERYVIA